jgi:hypothetical protein
LGQFAFSGNKRNTILRCKELCRGFNLWDRFSHAEALQALSHYGPFVFSYLVFAKRILGRDKGHTGYEKVVDLVLNSRRRASQKRYDDAVARLYRATEMLAQVRLMQEYEIDTGNVDLQKIPESIYSKYAMMADDKGKITIGLRKAYELLLDLGDSLGKAFEQRNNRLSDALTKRNASILAHGINPIDELTYRSVASTIEEFLEESLKVLGCPIREDLQLPTSLEPFISS